MRCSILLIRARRTIQLAVMKLLVVRHGEIQFNVEHRYLGALDPELTAKGIAQATALHSALPVHLDAIVCSPLRRAQQTAEILGNARAFSLLIPSL